MLRIRSSAVDATRAIIAGVAILLETRPRGIRIAGPKHEIAGSLAFRIVETALRGITRFPDTLEESDIQIVISLVPCSTPQTRRDAKKLLTALIRQEINSGRMIAVEVTSSQRIIKRHLTEYWVMTPEQWKNLQRTPSALPRGTTYQRALTSK